MYFLAWIMLGLVAGWVARKLLAENGYSPLVDNLTAAGGAVSGGLVMHFAASTGQNRLVLTSLAAFLGAAILTAFAILIVGRRRLV
jgi:uncharacterized membrane protein YeaQ/YmgE (transglycosylase-associated protein family)